MSEELQLHLYRLAVGESRDDDYGNLFTEITAGNGLTVGEAYGSTHKESQRVARQIVARWNAVEDALAMLEDEIAGIPNFHGARDTLRTAMKPK